MKSIFFLFLGIVFIFQGQGIASAILEEENRPSSSKACAFGNDVDAAVWNTRLLCSFFQHGFKKEQGKLNNVETIFDALQKIDKGYRMLQYFLSEYKEDGELFMIVTGHHYRRWGGDEFEVPLFKQWRRGLENNESLPHDVLKKYLRQKSAYDQLNQLHKELKQLIHSLHYFMWVRE